MLCCIDSTWESKEIKSNTTLPAVVGGAADFKYLIRIPKQELEEKTIDESGNNLTAKDVSGNKAWNDKYHQSFEDESDEDSDCESDEEETVILRCQTNVCQDGDKCVPVQFDFVVRVRFGDEEDTPQAADTNFPYTLPYGNSTSNSISKASSDNCSSAASTSTNSSIELINNK